jgi:hypothetical protein
LEANVNYPPERANIFLFRRCPSGLTTPGGYDCTGAVEWTIGRPDSEAWAARIQALHDPETDSDARLIGYYATQGEAVDAVWNARHETAYLS